VGLAAEIVEAEGEGSRELSAGQGGQYYRQHLTDDALMAFSFGVLEREQAIVAMESAQPWASFEMTDVRVVELSADSAVVVYRVQARRAGEDPYDAMIASTFVRRGVWKLAFHQQTPSPEGRPSRTRWSGGALPNGRPGIVGVELHALATLAAGVTGVDVGTSRGHRAYLRVSRVVIGSWAAERISTAPAWAVLSCSNRRRLGRSHACVARAKALAAERHPGRTLR
jgi:hypothetical protein